MFVNEWAIRIVVLCSFAAHLVLALLAGVRPRKATGVRVLLLWAAYQLGGFAGTYALGSMSLSHTTPQQQQQLALWAPFLLLHLAGPDNITAYSLDDTALAGRQIDSSSSTAGGGVGGSGLMWVSVVMFAIGVAKYVERAVAMRQADLGSMRSSSKKSKLERRRSFSYVRELGNELALLVAHDLLYITKGAFVDHLDDEHPLDREAVRSEIFLHGWKEMCKVVEMELSLTYDILYTKAGVVHTWFGYGIRIVSPAVSATSLMLFWFHGKEEQRRADIFITYILMAGTILLDIRWLLRAAVSTWTYAFLIDRPCCWLHHGLPARWRVLRRFVLSLDPCQLLGKEPTCSYRMWSGTIGQYNLFHDVRELDEALAFLPEFQESVLILHIATNVFYGPCIESDQNAASFKQLEAIKTLSDYMVFLVAVRPGMLQRLKLRSLYEATQQALGKIWSDQRRSCQF
ncbi:hypothetical protein DAI22_04g020600 [Oryza sativa Japonica Group]|nr:hypothetical protein DAI22_04g020600 [Oryza sativa Japonica Group]